MRKTKILAWILAILLIWGFVSADDRITYDPDANIQWKLNEWYIETEQDFVAWTISITDWTKTITILDRNLWATMTWGWIGVDAWSYGFYYQWWNNYGFPSSPSATITKTSTKVDASVYWPENPYSSDVFIKSDWDWSSVRNDNLRWWEWDDDTNWYWLTSDNPITGRQWPCPEWYHVPSLWDWNDLIVMWYNNRYHADLSTWDLFYLTSTATLTGVDDLTWDNAPVSLAFSEDMFIPFASIRWFDDWTVETSYIGLIWMLWSSTPDDEYSDHLNLLRTTRGNPKEWFFKVAPDYDYRGEAWSVRCFKDENEVVSNSVTVTFDVNWWDLISSWSIELTIGDTLDLSEYTWFKADWDFVWRNTDSWATVAIDNPTVTEPITLYAIFKKDLTITYLSWLWVDSIWADSDACTLYNIDTLCTLIAPTITVKDWYGTGIWNTWDVTKNPWDDITLIADDIYTASASPNTYIVHFDAWEWTWVMDDQVFIYDIAQNLTWNTFTRKWYTFSGWSDWNILYTDGQNVENLVTSGTITLIAQWTQNSSNWGSSSGWGFSSGGGSISGGGSWWWSWWWSWSHKVKPDPKEDKDKHEDENKDNKYNSGYEMWHGSATIENWYTREMNDAYEFAYRNGITTMNTIEKANMTWWLTRIAMAKMLSYYAINILWMKPDESRINKFDDVNDNLSYQYNNWVNLAYQLWIMWINMRKNMFRPFDLVTRAEFWTALSRMLYWLADGKNVYYETHLKKLAKEKIITNDNPNLRELRWYVMIMLMRSAMTGDALDNYLESDTLDEDNGLMLEVENYFSEAYKLWQIYSRIWDLQRLLKYLWYYNWDINNTYDKNTVNAVYDFQLTMWLLDVDDTNNPARWYLWPSTRDALNQKWAEFK